MPKQLTVILADGDFPKEPQPLAYLKNAARIVCCDGSAAALADFGLEPDVIIGDLDSLPEQFKARFADRLIHVSEQETNDLTKAFTYCRNQGWENIVILGATGKREDHTLGNLSLLADYSKSVQNLKFVTNYGIFFVLSEPATLPAVPGQQISIIALQTGTKVTSRNLKYPMDQLALNRWWQATLNEACAETFSLDFPEGTQLLIFQEHIKSTKGSEA